MFRLIASAVSKPTTIAVIIVVWLAVAFGLQSVSPSIEEVSTNDNSEFLPSGTEAFMALELGEEKFASSEGIPAIIIIRNPAGLSEADISKAREYVAALESDEAPDNIVAVISDLSSAGTFQPSASASTDSRQEVQTSPDGTALTVTVVVSGSPADEPFQNTIEWMRELDRDLGIVGETEVFVSGPAGILKDGIEVFASIDIRVTAITVALVLVLMLLIYRSPLLALLPLVSVGIALVAAQSIAALLADNLGFALNGQVTAIMSVLMFGVGTDFTLFIVSRYREEIIKSESKWEAIAASLRAVGPSIASSGGTTVIAMLALLFALSGSLRTMGPMLAMAVFVMMVAGLTLIPSFLVLMGKVAFWPTDPYSEKASRDSKVWSRVGSLVTTRPIPVIAVTLLLLLGIGSGVLALSPRFSFIEGFPNDAESKQGFAVLAESYPPGELAPAYVYVSEEGTNIYDHLEAVSSISNTLEEDASVERVLSVVNPLASADLPSSDAIQQVFASMPADADPSAALSNLPPEQLQAFQTFMAGRRFVSEDLTTTRLELVLKDDPYGVEAMNGIPGLRETAKSAASQTSLSGATVLVGGETATQTDDRSTSERDLMVITPIVIVAIWVILAILLRSVVAPTYLVLTVALSFFSALGLSVLVFQNILGHEGVGFSTIPFVFVFLVALGADYNIYVMSRIREEAGIMGLTAGTRRAVTRTGGVITSAGIILAGTFAVLTTFPLRDLFQLGFIVMVGILLDTFVVRGVLVPAIVTKLGHANWWPSKVSATPEE